MPILRSSYELRDRQQSPSHYRLFLVFDKFKFETMACIS
ncbi:hypothetical protein F383_37585 [Gossypium arboreum]|uniref:Uncharacterized protein n=1 Tax=Gossypium arboreum TaxID=29729 RepID=A0A0B0MBV2_GOSAR|nr:hypothetical protein F383_37585 [Gossypium arboreum]